MQLHWISVLVNLSSSVEWDVKDWPVNHNLSCIPCFQYRVKLYQLCSELICFCFKFWIAGLIAFWYIRSRIVFAALILPMCYHCLFHVNFILPLLMTTDSYIKVYIGAYIITANMWVMRRVLNLLVYIDFCLELNQRLNWFNPVS